MKKTVNIRGVDYILCSSGKVFSTKKPGLEMKQRKNEDGYPTIKLGSQKGKGRNYRYLVHRLIAEAFVPNPNSLPEVDHLDGSRTNSAADNLEWCTHQENISRNVAEGRTRDSRGMSNQKARLSEDDVIEIRDLYDHGIYTQAEIAKLYGIGWSTVHNVVRRFTWTYL